MAAKKLKRIALALGLVLVLADLCTSLFLIHDGAFLERPLPPFEAITHPNQRVNLEKMASAPLGNWTFDRDLGWTWRPSSVSPDGLYATNSLGARGPHEQGRRPAPGKRRVLTFGDSFTFCDEVRLEASFQFQLEQLDPDLEVLNFGVSGYGTDQAWLRYQALGRDVGAEVVCLGLMLENIGRNVNRYRPLWSTRSGVCFTKPRFLLDEHGGLELLPQPYDDVEELVASIRDGSVLKEIAPHEHWLGRPTIPTGKWSAFLRLACGYLAYKERSPARLWQDPSGEPFRITVAIAEAFHRQALEDGARLVPILIFPNRNDLEMYALPGRPYWTALFEELTRRGIPFVDLVAPLLARARERGDNPYPLFQGGHLSGEGNAIVAGTLRSWIQAHGQ